MMIKSANSHGLFFIVWAIVKPILLYPAGLYLLGFGLFPSAKGLQDWLSPFEQVGCVGLGIVFLIWFAASYYNLWRNLRSH